MAILNRTACVPYAALVLRDGGQRCQFRSRDLREVWLGSPVDVLFLDRFRPGCMVEAQGAAKARRGRELYRLNVDGALKGWVFGGA